MGHLGRCYGSVPPPSKRMEGGGVGASQMAQDGSKRASESARWPPRWPNIAEHGTILPPTDLQEAPRGSEYCSRRPSNSSRTPPGCPNLSNTKITYMCLSSRRFASELLVMPRDGPKVAQGGPKRAPRDANTAPRAPKNAPRAPEYDLNIQVWCLRKGACI